MEASGRPPAGGPDGGDRGYVRTEGVTKAYGGLVAVAGVSFSVPAGQTLALLGPSGCGKTTLLRCIAGLEAPEAGAIEIGGKIVFDAARRINLMPEQRELGVVFQSYAVWPHMSVAENVGFPLKVRGVPMARIAAEVDAILAMVGLADWRDKSAMALSGGQQQRVALARALVHRPRLVLFDEPMSNLDSQLREQMRLELKLLQQKLAFTSVYVTHDQAEAFALAQTVAVVNRGRIEMMGAPREVFRRPATRFVAQFFGYNVLDGKAVAVSADSVQVEIAGGVRLWGTAPGRVKPSDRVALCVRKERVGLADPSRPVPPARQSIAGVLCAAAFQGSHEDYAVAVGGVELRVSGAAGDLAPGPVVVLLNASDCIVLPAG
ncbi:MAG TPA: ABC transporter ATP-binding protein [Alphaproteobacteria bacterium]